MWYKWKYSDFCTLLMKNHKTWQKIQCNSYSRLMSQQGLCNKTFPIILCMWQYMKTIKHTDKASITHLVNIYRSSFCSTSTKKASCFCQDLIKEKRTYEIPSKNLNYDLWIPQTTASLLNTLDHFNVISALKIIFTNTSIIFPTFIFTP